MSRAPYTTNGKRVCNNISELYLSRYVTQREMAEALDVAVVTVRTWVNRQTDPQAALIPRIARYFGVSVERLFEGVE